MTLLIQGLQALTETQLRGMRRGIEKESLRVLAGGELASTPHPRALGAALTHPSITTDFSESQLELVTGVHPQAQQAIDQLTEIHQYRLPCPRTPATSDCGCRACRASLPADDAIPIGQLRQLQRRPGEERLPHRPRLPLRPAHADDLRHPLQLVAAGSLE